MHRPLGSFRTGSPRSLASPGQSPGALGYTGQKEPPRGDQTTGGCKQVAPKDTGSRRWDGLSWGSGQSPHCPPHLDTPARHLPSAASTCARLMPTQLTCRRCRRSTGTGCPAAMLSVNQLMSSRAGRVPPGGGAGLLSCQRTASSAGVRSITTCVTSELRGGKEPLRRRRLPSDLSLGLLTPPASPGQVGGPAPGGAATTRTCRRPARGSPWRAPGA